MYYLKYAIQLIASKYLINGMELHEKSALSKERMGITQYFLAEWKKRMEKEHKSDQMKAYVTIAQLEKTRSDANFLRARNNNPFAMLMSTVFGADAEVNANQREIDELYMESLKQVSSAITYIDQTASQVQKKQETWVPCLRREHLTDILTQSKIEKGDVTILLLGKKFSLPYRTMTLGEVRASIYFTRFLIHQQIFGDFNPESIRDLDKCHSVDPDFSQYYISQALRLQEEGKFVASSSLYYNSALEMEKGNKIRASIMYESAHALYNANSRTPKKRNSLYKKLSKMAALAKQFHNEAMEYYEKAQPLYAPPCLDETDGYHVVTDFLDDCEGEFGKLSGSDEENKDGCEQQPVHNPPACRVCGANGKGVKLRRCARCKDSSILYCSKQCQVKYWRRIHKSECTANEG
uniref:MYND-type domain-containing protein n=1 Tax=Percolomonas cosmopolitus TaxID=63605 RepID=A0A7S1PIQ1_9EUKA